jgi:hypothetical protein
MVRKLRYPHILEIRLSEEDGKRFEDARKEAKRGEFGRMLLHESLSSCSAIFTLPEQMVEFLKTRSNKSAYVASLIEQDKEYRAWKGQA